MQLSGQWVSVRVSIKGSWVRILAMSLFFPKLLPVVIYHRFCIPNNCFANGTFSGGSLLLAAVIYFHRRFWDYYRRFCNAVNAKIWRSSYGCVFSWFLCFSNCYISCLLWLRGFGRGAVAYRCFASSGQNSPCQRAFALEQRLVFCGCKPVFQVNGS